MLLVELTVKDFEERGVTVQMLRDVYDRCVRPFDLTPNKPFNPIEPISVISFAVPLFNYANVGKGKMRETESYMVRSGQRTIAFVSVPIDSTVDEVAAVIVKEIKDIAVNCSAPVVKALDNVYAAYAKLGCDPRADGKVVRNMPQLNLTVLDGPKVGKVGRPDRDEFQSEDIDFTLLRYIQQTVPIAVCEAVVNLIITLENQYELIHGVCPKTYERYVSFNGGTRLVVLVGDIDGHHLELTLNHIYLLDPQTLVPIPDFYSVLNDFQ